MHDICATIEQPKDSTWRKISEELLNETVEGLHKSVERALVLYLFKLMWLYTIMYISTM